MRPRLLLAIGVLAATVGLDSADALQAPPAPSELARSLQKRYGGIRDFRANFTQSVRGGVLRTIANEQRGEVRIKKPGKMRWNYGPPDRHVFVSDGSRIYLYTPNDRTVHISPMPTGADMSAAVLFLTGSGDLERDFTHSMPASHPDGEWHLTLTPKTRQDEFRTLTLAVDRKTLSFKGFYWTDHGGSNNTIRFTDLKENVGLADNEFTFQIPKGTHVVSGRGGQ